jgi:hypothetical protein
MPRDHIFSVMNKFPFNTGFFYVLQFYVPLMSLIRNKCEKSILSDDNVAINV